MHHINTGAVSEGATVMTLITLITGQILPYLQELSYILAIILTSCTIFVNRKKYWQEIKSTGLYKWIKNGFKKTNGRSSKTR